MRRQSALKAVRGGALTLPAIVILASCGSSSSGGPTGSAIPRCTTADLTVALPGPVPSGTSQRPVALTFTNHSSTSCSVYGYPGTQLRSATGTTWDLVRSPLVPPTTIVLAPGAAAHARLTYLPGDSADNLVFTPTTVVVIPPDQRTSRTVPWTGGPIVKQDEATHPGTYISALAPGA